LGLLLAHRPQSRQHEALDLGGGLPSPWDPFGKAIPRVQQRHEAAPTAREFAQVITSTLRAELGRHGLAAEGRVLQLEPGRATFGNVGIHVARVLGVKHQSSPGPLTWIQTDTSETNKDTGTAHLARSMQRGMV